ncbi:MAG: class I SAM-dependent methyltransferase [Anaerolineales bacterium]
MKPPPDPKNATGKRFGAFSARYVNSPDHASGSDLDELLRLADPDPSWHALDIATGGGHTALKLAPHVARLVVSDLSLRMLAAARQHLETQGVTHAGYCPADAENLPFAAGSFQLVTCRIAAHHFPNAARFVNEAARVLQPGGVLVVQDQVLPEDPTAARYLDAFETLRDPTHQRGHAASEWEALFTGAGLGVEAAQKVHKRHNFAAWTSRQDNSPQTVAMLAALVAAAPPEARTWLDPQDFGTPEASFAIHYLLIRGVKPGE